MISRFYKILPACLISLMLLFLTACNGSGNDMSVYKDTGGPELSPEEQKKMEEQKQFENSFMSGKSLIGVPYPNAVVLKDGKGDAIIEVGQTMFLDRIYVIGYKEDVDYRWVSDDPGIVQIPKGWVKGIAPGTTHLRCTSRSGEQIADLTVKVMEPQTSRIVKTLRLDGSGVVYWSGLTIKDNYMYIGTCDGIMKEQTNQYYYYKLGMDLNVVWRYDLGELGARGSAVLDSKGNIYFTVQDYDSPGEPNSRAIDRDIRISIYLYSLTNDGKFRFSKEITGKPGLYHGGMLNCAIDKDDTIYVADNMLYAFDTDGNIKWVLDPPGDKVASRSSPVFDSAGNLYVLMGGVLYRFNAGSGVIPAWQTTLALQPIEQAIPFVDISPPSFNADYSRIIVPLNKTVYCLDPVTGKKVWEITVPVNHGEFRANAAVDAAGVIYIGTKGDNESTLFAIKPDGSGFLWQKLIGGDLYCSPALGDDGMLYIGSEASRYGCFYCIDPATGEIKWMFAESIYTNDSGMEGVGFGSLNIQDGYIYCMSDALCKIKVEAKGYAPGAGWPCLRGSNDSSGYRAK